MPDPLVQIKQKGQVGQILLNRPKALNALNQQMVDLVIDALNIWRDDNTVAIILIHSTSDKGLCAGGDVREIRQLVLDDNAVLGDQFFYSEYRMNALIGAYKKPIVAMMHGITMGGGVGISAHASHRLVTEKTRLAMPESAIGFFCDVGGTYLLSRAPKGVGNYIGLTGNSISGDDAIFAKLADDKINASDIAALINALEIARFADDAFTVTDAVIAKFAQPHRVGDLEARQDDIAALFDANTVIQILGKLVTRKSDWSARTYQTMLSRSPFAQSVILRAIQQAKKMVSLNAALEVELVVARNMIRQRDFAEGVRAVLVDKDQTPNWTPPMIADVDTALVEAQFRPS